MSPKSSQKSVVLVILIIELVGFIVVQLTRDPDAKPFIEHQNFIVFGPGFLGALLLWLYHYKPSTALKVLSILCICLSCCIYIPLLLLVLKFLDEVPSQLEIVPIVVIILDLICNVVVLFQYGRNTREG